MRSRLYFVLLAVSILIGLQACKQNAGGSTRQEIVVKDTANIAADESCQPIVDEEKYIFTSLHDKAYLNIIYKSENDVLRLLLNDSVRMVLLSRDLTVQELKVLKTRNLVPEINRFAIDAITLIVNKASNDSLITVAEIKKMLNGQTKTDKNIVFDNPNSSLAGYLKVFSGNTDLKGKNIFALKNNKEVINYVSSHTDAIGITGFSWLNDPDNDFKDAVNKVKILAVKDENSKLVPNQYFKPSQSTLALKQYPLMRGLYVINCLNKDELGTEFAYFILNDRGQRLILRSGILPETIPEREINIKHTY